MSDYPRTPQEWQEYEAKIAQESANMQTEAASKIIIPDAGKTLADKDLTKDFLDRPNLRIAKYEAAPGQLIVPKPCCWSDDWNSAQCGDMAAFIIIDNDSGKGAVLCHVHAMRAAMQRKDKAETRQRAMAAAKAMRDIQRKMN